MEKLKEIDNFMKYFPQINLEEEESSGKNKKLNKKRNFEFINKNGNGIQKASTLKEINQKVNEKMSKIRAPKKEKKKRQRGKIKNHGDGTKHKNDTSQS
jgi:hypothetical protein